MAPIVCAFRHLEGRVVQASAHLVRTVYRAVAHWAAFATMARPEQESVLAWMGFMVQRAIAAAASA